MQREIKFRAWTKNFKEMYSMETLKKEAALRDFEDDDFVWQQYTGLKDKNSVEIYEGDIVKVSDGVFHYITNVDWFGDDSEWKYPAFDLNVSFITSDWVYESNALQSECLNGNLKVIGNIYENPELLEVE